MSGVLKVEAAARMLTECTRVDEAKDIRDKAKAVEVYLRQKKASVSAQQDAAELGLRAERRMGELLAGTPMNRGGRPGQTGSAREPVLSDIGVGKKESSRAQQLASLEEGDFESRVASIRARQDRITTGAVLADARRNERAGRFAAQGLPGARYPVVYADPPWQYEHAASENRAIENQYPTMSLEAICALPIRDLAAHSAVLFLWATSPKLAESMRVVEAWGFAYRTCMVWVKDKIGMGYWARQRHELLLVATRGNPPTPVPSARPDSVIESPRTRHSEKPGVVYEIIERMFPDTPRIELFCRSPRAGWDSWGNEVAA